MTDFVGERELTIDRALDILATHARLLVATDFDGTIASFTVDPTRAEIDPVARRALRLLSELPQTFVTVITGRSLADITPKMDGLEKVRLIGSHGYEFDPGAVSSLSPMQRDVLSRAESMVEEAVRRIPGALIERKSHGVAFHYRGVDNLSSDERENLTRALETLGAGSVRGGKCVLEFSVVATDKGEALKRVREHVLPTITVFIGDDQTDEDAFRSLPPPNISIKVGAGPSAAQIRLATHREAIDFLATLAEHRHRSLRQSWCEIDRHLFLSDLRTVALVDESGAITWMCAPRIDGVPIFGSLVAGNGGGHFRIAGGGLATQTYLGNSMIGVTSFRDVTIRDFFDTTGGRPYQRAGRSDLIRHVEGRGPIEIEFAPKLDFGRIPTRLSGTEQGLRVDSGQQRFMLWSPGIAWEVRREGAHDVARSVMPVPPGGLSLVLLTGTSSVSSVSADISKVESDTIRFWEQWYATLKLPSLATGLVGRSALVLRGLTYGPSGAIAAAATTSLPEILGGVRNWDYRFAWPRDACLSARALLRLGASGAAVRLLDWLLSIVVDGDEGAFLAPLYTVTGRSVQGEAEVAEATGYRASRPVRIGNLAAHQLQLDTLGPIAELMAALATCGPILTAEHLKLSERLVELVAERWNDPDNGIWEVRGAQRHYVHSKIMCWYTVRCCQMVARALGVEQPTWDTLMNEIRAQVEKEGYDERAQSYVAAYDLAQPDAALLWVVLSGFHPPDHPRSKGTVRYIMRTLVHDRCVYRYHFDDTLPGSEGEFIICRSWLIEALAMSGEGNQARALFDEMIARMSANGLLAEQWGGPERCALGNYPQAYSHLGLINAACAIAALDSGRM